MTDTNNKQNPELVEKKEVLEGVEQKAEQEVSPEEVRLQEAGEEIGRIELTVDSAARFVAEEPQRKKAYADAEASAAVEIIAQAIDRHDEQEAERTKRNFDKTLETMGLSAEGLTQEELDKYIENKIAEYRDDGVPNSAIDGFMENMNELRSGLVDAGMLLGEKVGEVGEEKDYVELTTEQARESVKEALDVFGLQLVGLKRSEFESAVQRKDAEFKQKELLEEELSDWKEFVVQLTDQLKQLNAFVAEDEEVAAMKAKEGDFERVEVVDAEKGVVKEAESVVEAEAEPESKLEVEPTSTLIPESEPEAVPEPEVVSGPTIIPEAEPVPASIPEAEAPTPEVVREDSEDEGEEGGESVQESLNAWDRYMKEITENNDLSDEEKEALLEKAKEKRAEIERGETRGDEVLAEIEEREARVDELIKELAGRPDQGVAKKAEKKGKLKNWASMIGAGGVGGVGAFLFSRRPIGGIVPTLPRIGAGIFELAKLLTGQKEYKWGASLLEDFDKNLDKSDKERAAYMKDMAAIKKTKKEKEVFSGEVGEAVKDVDKLKNQKDREKYQASLIEVSGESSRLSDTKEAYIQDLQGRTDLTKEQQSDILDEIEKIDKKLEELQKAKDELRAEVQAKLKEQERLEGVS